MISGMPRRSGNDAVYSSGLCRAKPNQAAGADMDCIAAVIIGGRRSPAARAQHNRHTARHAVLLDTANGMGLLSMNSYARSS